MTTSQILTLTLSEADVLDIRSALVAYQQTEDQGEHVERYALYSRFADAHQEAEEARDAERPTPESALREFASVWGESETYVDIAKSLTCDEADVLADLFRVAGEEGVAVSVIEFHAESDDEGDMHHVVTR